MGFSHASVSGRPQASPPPPPVNKPGPVQALTLKPGDHELGVRWRAPSSNGGRDITRYPVRYKPAAATAWISNPEVTSGTETTVPILTGDERMPLTNGVSHHVQVRACNGPTDRTDCGNWTQGLGTPEEPRPRNLNLTPLGDRRARLSWTWPDQDPNNQPDGFYVTARVFGIEPGAQVPYPWMRTRSYLDTSSRASPTSRIIELHEFVEFDGSLRGLAHHQAYEIQVQAEFSSDELGEMGPTTLSDPSDSIVIIDTPITRATAANASNSRQVVLEHKDVGRILEDSDYGENAETIEFRYYRVSHDLNAHTDPEWNPDVFTPIGSATSLALVSERIYGVQVVVDPRGGTNKPPAYAARAAYVWPSNRVPVSRERIASFPVGATRLNNTSYTNPRTYAYRICDYTLPPNNLRAWEDIINDAFERWELATGGLIQVDHESGPCADFTPYIRVAVALAISNTEFGDLDLVTPEEKKRIRMEIERAIANMFKSLALMNISTIDDIETPYQGVLDEDATVSDVSLTYGADVESLLKVGVFPELAEPFGLASCGFTHAGCALTNGVDYSGKGLVTDIIINYQRYHDATPSSPTSIAYDMCHSGFDVVLGSSDQRLFRTLVHEAGHALGIRYPGATEEDEGHPNTSLEDSIMAASATSFNFCSPTQLDLLAVHAMYQSDYPRQ